LYWWLDWWNFQFSFANTWNKQDQQKTNVTTDWGHL